MSRAKPASAEVSPGSVALRYREPPATPTASSRSAASTPRIRRAGRDCGSNSAACLWLARVLRLQVVRGGAGRGDEAAAGACGALLEGGVLLESLDELVDARVAGLLHLELVTPGLQRDRLVEARIGAHQHVVGAADLL